ncbi:translocation/assembly module TamB domain-containing protein [Myroides odoratimimus]|uniref:translocation/assembly module TamB domain-containing protein n=1 Tax=Myroides odoratimimus TaxID=76832 RepID=UPI002581DBB0|nr:translocation/assembly module TamB domain-containing protein [Myroides odoratimimus]MDM1400861.1 translocation/assembly module TamB domain-containing protein [Myroides odoratimimus]MDM1410593.1 translocation/assembly module TamB domain-containing protein [Myroides odoratimimus]MDM1452751.1 translocation/assembly module TamB domain-containing protein [Myroides odoratimimus]MDM1463856.1 translocation/assembly module TamB domain-containing protein [Myroides odoratimimus]
MFGFYKKPRVDWGKFKTLIVIKKFNKILFRLLLAVFSLVVIIAGALSLPVVQTFLAQHAMEKINSQFGTKLEIERLAVSIFGRVTLKEVTAKDNHDTNFIEIKAFTTSILDFNELIQGRLYFGKTKVDGLYLRIHKYKGEEFTTLDQLINAFDDGKEGEGKFRLKSSHLTIKNTHLIISDDEAETPVAIDFKNINGEVEDFFIKGPDIYANVLKSSFEDNWGMGVTNLSGNFTHTKTSISMEKLDLQTKKSAIEGDLKFTYALGDMKYFVDKVNWDFEIRKAVLNSSDLNAFTGIFAENKMVYVTGHINGVMNDFTMKNVNLVDDNMSNVRGLFSFRNVFDKVKPFWMKANVDRLFITRDHIVGLMPELLHELLPTELTNLGQVDIKGDIEMTKRTLKTDIDLLTSIGKGKAVIDIENLDNPNLAAYKGDIVLEKFDLGEFIKNQNFGLTSVDLEVDGVGFNQKSLNTSIKGDVFSFDFAKYKYTNIAVDGLLKMPYYRGLVHSQDPNLQLDFNGMIDLSSEVKNYDFIADVDYADLYALHLVNDTLSKFKGQFEFKASGNTLDDLAGTFTMRNTTYINSKDEYVFGHFTLNSEFNPENERLISFVSQEAIEGYIKGKFLFKDLRALFTNALGSLYTNYSPYKIKEEQYLDFDITVHNRLIEVFLPQLTLSASTHVEGNIDNDDNIFKLNFSSPSIGIEDFNFYNVLLDVNNSNPLYNTYVSLDSMKSKFYRITDFNLLNLTHNDTLFVRSEFKGGTHGKDKFNLNLYHTINEENLSVVGFKKSDIFLKDFLWSINESDNKKNKVIFNKKLEDFTIDDLSLSHNGQEVNLTGAVRDSTYKHFDLEFKQVDLAKFAPDISNLEFAGNIDGDLHFSQVKDVFQPKVNINIDELAVNKVRLGDLAFHVDGDERLKNFKVQSSIVDNEKEKFYLNGDLAIVNKQMQLNLESGFKDFSVKPIEPLLKTIVSDVRGTTSGKINIQGTAKKPEVNGRLHLNKAGMKSKFTGVDYNFEEDAALDLTERQFILRKVRIIDSKHKTEGIIDGDISHKAFNDWALNLVLSSPNLLALDTKFEEGSIYYGKAFINGMAKLSGPVEMLAININATSNKGTAIKIPLKEAQGTGENNFIHFLSPQEKALRLKGKEYDMYRYRNSGIELDFEFVLTPDAEIEIILDRESGHAMRGRGAGFITMEINTLGKFNMWGDFQAYEGEYNFRYGGLIDKKFVVKKYGTIRWDGDPMNAMLDLQAIYHTDANPSVIIDNSIINRKVPTDVAIVLNGSLSNPEVDFEINFPTVSSVVKSELDYRLSERDMRERQAMALLATGAFFSSDNSSSTLAGSLFERASSIFDEIFSDEDDKFKVGLNYAQGERNPYTQTEGRVGVTFSTKVNDRISVNGKLGVPVGGVEQSVIVGDVEVMLRLNEEGSLSARVFNRENDINYIGEGIGYTQGVGLSYEVDFDTFKELISKILNRAKTREKDQSKNKKQDTNRSEELPDSDFNRDFIKFYENRRKSSTAPSDTYNLTK